MKHNTLSDGEWKLMHLLWTSAPRKIADFVNALRDDTGWSKATVNIMLGRLVESGAVRCDDSGRCKLYYPSMTRQEAETTATKRFLAKVYGGSVGTMVAAMAGQQVLSQEDIDELYAILREAEKGAHHD